MNAVAVRFVDIGRAEDCHYRIDDGYASPHHARISQYADGSIYLEDLGSTNGTYCDGVKVWRAPLSLTRPCRIKVGRTAIEWPSATSSPTGPFEF